MRRDAEVREKLEQGADNRNEEGCDRNGKNMDFFFFCPRVSKMSVISGAAVETFLITRFERICSSEASVDATVRQQDAVPYLQNHFPGSSLLQLCCIH